MNVLKAVSTKGKLDDLLEALSGLPDKERTKFAKLLVRLERSRWDEDKHISSESWEKEYAPYLDGGTIKKVKFRWENVDLALLGTGNGTQVRGIRLEELEQSRYLIILQILRERKPKWINTWIASQLRRRAYYGYWEFLYQLITEGICDKPTVEGYFHILCEGAGEHKKFSSISAYLRAHPELIEDVWRLFELETDGFLDQAQSYVFKGKGRTYEHWGRALHVLSDEGLMDRERLLDTCLSAMQGPFKAARLTALATLYGHLEVSPEESAARQGDYLSLLGGGPDRVAKSVMTWIKNLEKSKALDEAALLRDGASLFVPTSKAVVADGLKLLGRILKGNPKHGSEVIRIVAEHGVVHPSTDIQAQAVALLSTNQEWLDDGIHELLRERIGEIAPSLQAEVRVLCGEAAVAEEAVVEVPDALPLSDGEIAAIPSVWRALAGVDCAQAALASNTTPPALSFDLFDVPVTSGLDPVPPLETAEAVVELLSRRPRDAMDNERIVDGMSRLEPGDSEAFGRLAAPVKEDMKGKSPFGQLVICWLSRGKTQVSQSKSDRKKSKVPFLNPKKMPGLPLSDSLDQRLIEIGKRLAKGKRVPVLSTPTHAGGWIHPAALVERVNTYTREKVPIARYDLILALLRLAPEGRAQAAADLAASKALGVRAVHWTLTGEGGGVTGDDPTIWLAATRSRAPGDDMSVPGVETGALEGADGRDATRFRFMTEAEKAAFAPIWEACTESFKDVRERSVRAFIEHFRRKREDSNYYKTPECLATEYEVAVYGDDARLIHTPHGVLSHRFHIAVENSWSKTVDYEGKPTVQLHNLAYGIDQKSFDDFLTPMHVSNGRLVWPLNSDPGFVAALVAISSKLEKKSKSWPEHACLENLHEPDRPISLPYLPEICSGPPST